LKTVLNIHQRKNEGCFCGGTGNKKSGQQELVSAF
jgi:hypothetical protein